MKIYFADDFES